MLKTSLSFPLLALQTSKTSLACTTDNVTLSPLIPEKLLCQITHLSGIQSFAKSVTCFLLLKKDDFTA